jgi:hypothetical protein
MNMILAALALTLNLDVVATRGGVITVQEPKPVCGIRVIGYHFYGKPGQQFRYARETWTIPREGSIELIASKRHKYYELDGQRIPVADDGPMSQFSFRIVALPQPEPVGSTLPNPASGDLQAPTAAGGR